MICCLIKENKCEKCLFEKNVMFEKKCYVWEKFHIEKCFENIFGLLEYLFFICFFVLKKC